MMTAGYLNLFEQDCCFVGLGSTGAFALLQEGDILYPRQGGPPMTLRHKAGRWFLEGGPSGCLQGMQVWFDCPLQPPVKGEGRI